MVSLVGFWQWHHERSGQSLERSAVLGIKTGCSENDHRRWSASSSGNRAGQHVGYLRIWRPWRNAAGEAHLVSRRNEAEDLAREGNSAMGQRCVVHWR